MNDLIKEQSRCIAHEMRNHISICELYTQIIRKNLEKEGIEIASIDNALNCINRSLKIMSNNLLDLKSLNNFSPKICSIKKILEEGIKLSQVYICEKDIKITSDLQTDANVYIDENKFLACIVNIIKNAIEAIKREGNIEIYAEEKDEKICIKISNNGEAIPVKSDFCRNKILHGEEVEYGSINNVIRAFLIIEFLDSIKTDDEVNEKITV